MNQLLTNLLEEFDEAAQSWGYLSDQGSQAMARDALDVYNEAKGALTEHLNAMSSTIASQASGPHRVPCVAVVGELKDHQGRKRAFRYLLDIPFEMVKATKTIQDQYMPGSTVLTIGREL